MILHESAKTCHRKIHLRISERLPKLIRISCEEISGRTKEIYALESIRYFSSQPDAIHRSADLPKMFSRRPRMRIAGLIMIFATFAVSHVGTPEGDQSRDVNLRAERFVR